MLTAQLAGNMALSKFNFRAKNPNVNTVEAWGAGTIGLKEGRSCFGRTVVTAPAPFRRCLPREAGAGL